MRQLPHQCIRVLTRPATAFAEEMGKGSWGMVWLLLLGLVVLQTLNSVIANASRNVLSPNPADQAYVLGYALGQFLFEMLLVLLFFFMWMGILYGLARAFGGQGTFRAQSYASLLFYLPLSLISAVLALVLIPARVFPAVIVLVMALAVIIVALALLAYDIVLQIFAIMAVHRLSGGRATAVVLIPLGAVVSLFGCLIFAATVAHP
jgi:hypothetical protein